MQRDAFKRHPGAIVSVSALRPTRTRPERGIPSVTTLLFTIPKIITARQSAAVRSVYLNRAISIRPQTLQPCPGFPCPSPHGPIAYALCVCVCVSNASQLMDILFSFFPPSFKSLSSAPPHISRPLPSFRKKNKLDSVSSLKP